MRNAWVTASLAGLLTVGLAAESAGAVNVERQGSENPVLEVAKSTIYGGLAGLVVGTALAIAVDDDNDGDIIRYSYAAGTLVGLGAGIYWVAHRPSATALIEVRGGDLALHPPLPEVRADGGVQLRVASFSF